MSNELKDFSNQIDAHFEAPAATPALRVRNFAATDEAAAPPGDFAATASPATASAEAEEEDPFYVEVRGGGRLAETKPGQPAQNGAFTVERHVQNWATFDPGPLTVNYTIRGTASNGADYESIQGSVTFPANEYIVDIPIIVKDDKIVEGTETIEIELHEGAKYDVRPGAELATATIADDEQVEIVIQTFIPDKQITVFPAGTFAGDNRKHFDTTPEVADNDYRTRFQTTVPSNFFNTPAWSQDAGTTKRLDPETGRVTETGEASTATQTLWNNPGTTYNPSTGTLRMTVGGGGKDPLVWYAAAVDYVFSFDIKADVVTFVGGHHDAYPAYEVFVKDKGKSELTLVYGFMPGVGWQEPYYLGQTGEEVQVTGPGVNVPR